MKRCNFLPRRMIVERDRIHVKVIMELLYDTFGIQWSNHGIIIVGMEF
jgi:hypothetical protein